MRSFLAITSALSDTNRVRIVTALQRHGELCVCQIVEMLGLAVSTVSKHLSILHSARLLDARKQGRWMYYRIADSDVPDAACNALNWAAEALKDDPMTVADDAALNQILCCTPEDLCKRQTARIRGNESSTCCSSAPATRAAAKWPKGSRGTSVAT